jgi:hypothetical protein
MEELMNHHVYPAFAQTEMNRRLAAAESRRLARSVRRSWLNRRRPATAGHL